MARSLNSDLRPDPTPLPGRPSQVAVLERWVRRWLGTIDHETRVADVAVTLFDLTAEFHRLGRKWSRLLRLASLVHDVGRSVDDAEHPAIGAAMILSDSTLPLAPAERRALAYLTLYHRGDVPSAGEDDILHRNDDHGEMRAVLALLRAADALDSRSLESPRLVFALRGRARRPELRVTCYLHRDTPKVRRAYRRRRKFDLLEEVVGCRVHVEVAMAHSLRMVA